MSGSSFDLIKLLDGSPAIDAGNPAGCPDFDGVLLTDDQRGQQRPVPVGSRCDMGGLRTRPAGWDLVHHQPGV